MPSDITCSPKSGHGCGLSVGMVPRDMTCSPKTTASQMPRSGGWVGGEEDADEEDAMDSTWTPPGLEGDPAVPQEHSDLTEWTPREVQQSEASSQSGRQTGGNCWRQQPCPRLLPPSASASCVGNGRDEAECCGRDGEESSGEQCGTSDTTIPTCETQDCREDDKFRRMPAASRLDLLQPMTIRQDKKGSIRLCVKRICGLHLNSFAATNRDRIFYEDVFGLFLSADGKSVDILAWRSEVQYGGVDLIADPPRGTSQSLPVEEALAAEVLSEHNLPHLVRAPEGLDSPLAHYWINSSHNSYLQGNQLTSDCSTEALVSLLHQGVRVVELDVYEGQRYGIQGPCVLHGGTMTKAISLEACLEAIRGAAFAHSRCPVIITLENHLKEAGQRQCAALLQKILGPALYVPSPTANFLPSPGELQDRFILRDKVIVDQTLPKNFQSSWRSAKLKAPLLGWLTSKRDRSRYQSDEVGREIDDKEEEDQSEPTCRPARVPELHALISLGNVKFVGEESSSSVTCTSCSVSEGKLQQIKNQLGLHALRRYTSRHLVRTYPASFRVDSSNFDPQDSWESGCQMVALNGQGSIFFHPHSAWLNAAKFRGNGGCGFVPKPQHITWDARLGGGRPHPVLLRVKILGGDGWETFKDFDRGKAPDSYVCVEIAGVRGDRSVERTQVFTATERTGKKAQPIWRESFEFCVTDPELATLLFVAWDQDVDFDDLLGQYGFPLSELLPGWRRVPLLNGSGEPQEGNPSLLCHFELG